MVVIVNRNTDLKKKKKKKVGFQVCADPRISNKSWVSSAYDY